MYKLLSIFCVLPLLSCSEDTVDCTDELDAGAAIQIYLDSTESGCNYKGTLEVDGDSSKMKCTTEDDQCLCEGGSEYAIYRIYITDLDLDRTMTALQEVSPSPSPQCFAHDTLEQFHVIDEEDGLGGAGGAEN